MHTQKTENLKQNNKRQAHSTLRAGARTGAGRGPGPGPKPAGAVGLRFFCFSYDFLTFWVRICRDWVETNIRLDLSSNVCKIIPGTGGEC